MEVERLSEMEDLDDSASFASPDMEYTGEMEDDYSMQIATDFEDSVLYNGPIFEGVEENKFLLIPKHGVTKGNIANPVKGFDEEEKRICPLVDRKSAILYDIVQQLEEEQLEESITILKKYKKAIVFPREFLDEEGGSFVAIKICEEEDSKKLDEERLIELELEEQRKALGDPEEVEQMYRAPFDHGWTREVVLRIHATAPGIEMGEGPLTSIGEVFYRDPEGNKIRSMKQIAVTLEKNPLPGVSIKNFTFAKGPVGIKDPRKEIIRRINSGRLPVIATPRPMVKIPKKPNSLPPYDFVRNGNSLVESPASVKLKSSSSRRSIQPPKRYATGQAFMYPEKRSKMGTKKDSEYQSDNDMEMGMLPPKYPRGKEDYAASGGNNSDAEDNAVKKRGRPPTKKIPMKEDFEGSYNGEHDSALFQISAFHNHSQSSLFEGIDDAHSNSSIYGGMMHSGDHGMEGRSGGQTDRSEELLPCSIRCPGMTGEIPTLQCTRCLCLYHPECLALPPNQNFRNFLCANCEGEPVEPSPPRSGVNISQLKSNSSEQAKKPRGTWLPSKIGEPPVRLKKPPPPLLPAFSKFGKFQGINVKGKLNPPKLGVPPALGRGFPQLSANRNSFSKVGPSIPMLRPSGDSMSISPITMKRGRGRPPKDTRSLPNLSGRNLTITPISMRPRLPVPSLAPMTKGKSLQFQFAPPKLKSSQQYQTQRPASAKGRTGLPALGLGGSPVGKIGESLLKDMKELTRGLKPLVPSPVSLLNKGPGGFPTFKRYPQSIVSIGTKKFVAVPRGNDMQQSNLLKKSNQTIKKAIPASVAGDEPPCATAEENVEKDSAQNEPEIKEATSHRFGTEKIVVEKVFRYLNVKDLLRASRVCRLWNAVSTDTKSWKVLKMKNHRISDIQGFATFLKKQSTEVVDFRKMISAEEMDWDNLFACLGDVDSLRQIILGPRTLSPERVSELSQQCPNIEVVTS